MKHVEKTDVSENGRRFWTPEEDAVLREVAGAKDYRAAAQALGRTLNACHLRANYLGFSNRRAAAGYWSDERVAQLRTLVARGETSTEIAAALGGVTRSAVLGKCGRLGLALRSHETAHLRPGAAQRKFERERAEARRRLEAAEAAEAARRRAEAERRAAASRAAVDRGAFPQACGLFELTTARCRFPLYDVADLATARFCGAETRDRACPYCAGHAALAYRPAPAGLAA